MALGNVCGGRGAVAAVVAVVAGGGIAAVAAVVAGHAAMHVVVFPMLQAYQVHASIAYRSTSVYPKPSYLLAPHAQPHRLAPLHSHTLRTGVHG